MRPPESPVGIVATSVGLVVAVGAVGAGAGYVFGRKTGNSDDLTSLVLTVESGLLATIAAGFVGIVVAAASPKWREVGEGVAVVGIGAPLVLATMGVVKQSAQLGAATGKTVNVTSADSGTSVNLNVGDTLNVLLPSASTAPTVSSTGVLAASTSQVSGTYSFVAVKAGTVTVFSGTDFTITVTVA